jgi:hypothetical protein
VFDRGRCILCFILNHSTQSVHLISLSVRLLWSLLVDNLLSWLLLVGRDVVLLSRSLDDGYLWLWASEGINSKQPLGLLLVTEELMEGW